MSSAISTFIPMPRTTKGSCGKDDKRETTSAETIRENYWIDAAL